MGAPLKASESDPRAPLHHVKRKGGPGSHGGKQEMVTQVLECQSCGRVVFSEGEQDIKARALLSLISDRAGTEIIYVLPR